MSNESVESTPAKPERKTHRGVRSKAKRAEKAARQPIAERVAAAEVSLNTPLPKIPPVKEGYRRHFVDLRIKDSEYVGRLAKIYTADRGREISEAEAIELAMRAFINMDPTKAGIYTGGGTKPAVPK